MNPGTQVTSTTTTNGTVPTRATIQAPSENDGLSKNGARASWGVKVTAGSARAARTLVVTPKNCTTLAYTGVTGARRAATRRSPPSSPTSPVAASRVGP